MYVFDFDSHERWMVYDESLPDSVPVVCREIRKRDDAVTITMALNARDYPNAPHRFVRFEEDGYSVACRYCGRNGEDPIHVSSHPAVRP